MHPERGGHLKLLENLHVDDGIRKGPFTVCGLQRDEPHISSGSGLVLDFADATREDVRCAITHMPTRYLSFYCCYKPTALPLEMELPNSRNSKELEIVYVGEDLLLEGGDFAPLQRRAIPTRCLMNGDLLHDYRPVPKKTRRHVFKIPANMPSIHLQWDVENRARVTYVTIPVPVADVRLLP